VKQKLPQAVDKAAPTIFYIVVSMAVAMVVLIYSAKFRKHKSIANQDALAKIIVPSH